MKRKFYQPSDLNCKIVLLLFVNSDKINAGMNYFKIN